MNTLEVEEVAMNILLKKCEKNTLDVTNKEIYDILFYYQREGRLGAIRFPKRIRDLYERVSEKFGKNKMELTTHMVDFLNNKPSHKYENNKFIDTHNVPVLEGEA